MKLISDLFHYYENNLYWSSSISRYDERYARIYLKCKALMDRLDGIPSVIAKTADNLKYKFSSEYISQQIKLMVSMQSTNQTNDIRNGKVAVKQF